MNILFISIGKKHEESVRESILDYTNRISRIYQTNWQIINSSDIEDEALKIDKILHKEDFIVSLDQKGDGLDSPELSKLIEKTLINSYKRIVFIIGGSYGLSKKIIGRSNKVLSLSKLTFPHQIVRLIIVEAVYRAISISKNLPYHHQ